MCGVEVRNWASTAMRPRASTWSPATGRFSRSVAATRPAENSTMSATMRLPDSRCSTRPLRRLRADGQRLDGLAEAEGDVAVPELVDQLVDDLTIEEVERPVPALDQGDGHAEGGEDRRVLDADHAGPHHRQCARQMPEPHASRRW